MDEKIRRIEKIGNFLIINGEYWIPTQQEFGKGSQKIKFKKADKEDFETVRKLAKRLAKNIDAEQILIDALAETPPKIIKKIAKSIFKKKVKKEFQPKVIQRHGCIDMKIGKYTIPIR